MKRTWTIIRVRDVSSSFRWYQSLFGQSKTAPGHDYWGQILDMDGTVLFCLHQWGAHDELVALAGKYAQLCRQSLLEASPLQEPAPEEAIVAAQIPESEEQLSI